MLRVTAISIRFVHNCKRDREKNNGHLNSNELTAGKRKVGPNRAKECNIRCKFQQSQSIFKGCTDMKMDI